MRRFHDCLRNFVFIGWVCLAVGLGGADTARGDIIFDTGTIGGVSNVLMGSTQQGLQVIGGIDGRDVLFTQPTFAEMVVASGGQATIQAVDGAGFTSLRTQLLDGGLFGRIEINMEFVQQKGVEFRALANDGTIQTFTSGPGVNRINALGTDGMLIEYIDIIAPANQIASIRQVRMGGLIQPAAVPEAGSWLLLGCVLAGAMAAAAVRRRCLCVV